jgi:filamentous hemagglutinin family protein
VFKTLSPWFGLSLCILGYFCATNNPALAEARLDLGDETAPSLLAQVTSDDTVNTQVTENGNTAEITGGETRGDNLFHSFQDFSVETGNEASFLNANDISNIFSRVTGGNISNIDGLISANGSANLFLINPAGIIFGEGAQLDIGGSFYGSSASSILFEDGEFSATDLDNPPLLTINAPIGLGFRDEPGDIVNRASTGDGLEVGVGENISLIGGNVSIEDGGIVFAPEGRIELGGLTESGIISFTEDNNLSFPDAIARGDVSLTDSALVSVGASSADTTTSQAGNIEINTSSLIVNNKANLLANVVAQDRGGNITINATEDVSFANGSNVNVSGAPGGSINIDAKNLSITSGSNFFNSIPKDTGFAGTQSGDIKINLAEDFLLDGLDSESITSINNTSTGLGNPGNIEINARDITVQNNSSVSAFSSSQQDGNIGEVSLNARGDILFKGDSSNRTVITGITNFLQEAASGVIGDINVQAQNLTLTNGASIASQVAGSADGGNINIDVADTIKIDGFTEGKSQVTASEISTNIGLTGTGNAGKININTQNLELSRNGQINASNAGRGNGGDININAEQIDIGQQGNANITASSISAQTFEGSEGDGGNITINTGSLSINDGTEINANLQNGVGEGGNIKINARDEVSVNGTGILSNSETEIKSASQISAQARNTTGNAGNIEIDTSKLSITNSAIISANISVDSTTVNEGGNGGDITINASDSVNVSGDGSSIQADFFAFDLLADNPLEALNINSNAGKIEIDTSKLFVTNGAIISADIFSKTGNGGDITINASDLVNVSDGDIKANPLAENSTAKGGNLTIETGRLSVVDGAQISVASLGDGDAGSLTISAKSIELRGFTETYRGGIFASVLRGSGNGGDINIFTKDLTIADGAVIAASNFPSLENSSTQPGTGQPGNINVEANSIRLANGGRIVAATQSTKGEGANINLQTTGGIILQDNSFISAEAFGDANGGNLTIDSEFIVASPEGNNDIIASASQGQGGNITINAESLFGIEERPLNDSTNDINASSEFALDGAININTSDINPIQGATELPSNVVEPAQTTAQTCSADREGKANNGLAIAGKGGVPPAPDTPLNSENIISSEQNSAAFAIPQPIETSQGKIQPARGIKVSKSGKISLTAYRTNNAGERIPEGKINCGQI